MSVRMAVLFCAVLWAESTVAGNDGGALMRVNYSPSLAQAATEASSSPSATTDQLPPVELSEPARVGEPIDLTAEHDDIWARIRQGFSMPDLDNELVRRQQIWYLNRPDYLRRVVERSRRYMHFIVEEIEKRGMPTELALLPIVESAYNPMALSTARASGLWQFIPSTGRSYKLDQTWWVDERRDIVASTGAALDYLKYVYEMHGDWQLALASYNWGEGAVGRAIAKNRAKGLPTDYSSLKMPKETQNYVPKLQALKNIIGDPSLWAVLDIPEIANRPYFSTIPKPADMDVKVAAKLAEMPVDEFVALNPAHNRPVIKADIPLVLPADKVDRFLANLDEHDDPLSHWQVYTFQKTDKLEKVAARHGISLAQLRSVNGLSGRKSRVRPGQMLLVPSRGGSPIDVAGFLAPIGEPEVSAPKNKHKRKGVGARTRANAGAEVRPAVAKAKLKKPTAVAQTARKTQRYTVRKGDTLESIARKFNVDARDISRRNALKAALKPGQHLLIAATR